MKNKQNLTDILVEMYFEEYPKTTWLVIVLGVLGALIPIGVVTLIILYLMGG